MGNQTFQDMTKIFCLIKKKRKQIFLTSRTEFLIKDAEIMN